MKKFKVIFKLEAGFGVQKAKTMRARDAASALALAARFCEEFNCDLVEVVAA
jgi:hypothetical protein